MASTAKPIMLAALLLAAYLALWPVPIKPQAWHAPAAPGYTGAHASNARLSGPHQISLRGESGPEQITAGPDGKLYMGVSSGRILRMAPDGRDLSTFADTGGRPLGLAFDADGNLAVADAHKGLLAVAPDGTLTVLATHAGGQPIRFADGVTIARNGKIYLTDASARFAPAEWGSTTEAAMLDIFEQSASGRVLEYDPATRQVRVVATGLAFPNGIVMNAAEDALVVAESARYRVWKIAVGAERLDIASAPPHLARILLDNLPGYPDNLTRGTSGKLWLGLAGQRNDLDRTDQRPWLRSLALRIPRALWAMPKPYGHVFSFDEDGTVDQDLQDPSGNSSLVTGATEIGHRLYIHNADGTQLGWLER